MLEYTLNGPRDEQNIDARATLLTAWLNRAAQKGDHISELRQKNLNYALIIFAALFTVSMKFPMPSAKPYSVCISLALLGIMIVFCVLDRRYHRYIHGWGETEKVIMQKISDVVNQPDRDVKYPRYVEEAEKTAEKFGPQPVIFYFLIAGALTHLAYFLFLAKSTAIN